MTQKLLTPLNFETLGSGVTPADSDIFFVTTNPNGGNPTTYEMTYLQLKNFIISDKGAVTQITSITTAVTLNNRQGIITTVSSILAPDSYTGFTLNNSNITTSSLIVVSIVGYTGTGIPSVIVQTLFAGQAVIKITNSHATEALSQPLNIGFQVLN